jgi:hypothetical protein
MACYLISLGLDGMRGSRGNRGNVGEGGNAHVKVC